MFDVYFDNLSGDVLELQNIARQWNIRVQDIYVVENKLKEMSGMDEVIYRLGRIIKEGEENSQSLGMLTQVTEKISQQYSKSERSIINNTEGSRKTVNYLGLGNNDLLSSKEVNKLNIFTI